MRCRKKILFVSIYHLRNTILGFKKMKSVHWNKTNCHFSNSSCDTYTAVDICLIFQVPLSEDILFLGEISLKIYLRHALLTILTAFHKNFSLKYYVVTEFYCQHRKSLSNTIDVSFLTRIC